MTFFLTACRWWVLWSLCNNIGRRWLGSSSCSRPLLGASDPPRAGEPVSHNVAVMAGRYFDELLLPCLPRLDQKVSYSNVTDSPNISIIYRPGLVYGVGGPGEGEDHHMDEAHLHCVPLGRQEPPQRHFLTELTRSNQKTKPGKTGFSMQPPTFLLKFMDLHIQKWLSVKLMTWPKFFTFDTAEPMRESLSGFSSLITFSRLSNFPVHVRLGEDFQKEKTFWWWKWPCCRWGWGWGGGGSRPGRGRSSGRECTQLSALTNQQTFCTQTSHRYRKDQSDGFQ